MRTRTISTTLAVSALVAQSLGSAAATLAITPSIVTFSFTGAEQTWPIPVGVTSIHVDLVGAPGGTAGTFSGGHGDAVSGDLDVTSVSALFIEVGGSGANNAGGAGGDGGFNGGAPGYPANPVVPIFGGGAGGGGATDIRTTARANAGTLASRLMVAAGGGGAGHEAAGGAARAAGSGVGTGSNAATGGGAGTLAAGGAGGLGNAGLGTAGAVGVGGRGSDAAGGGGGGLFGGGGGGTGISGSTGIGAGGGGGSSSTGTATNTSVAVDTGGVPSVTITYASSGGSVDATVTMASSAACLQLSATAIDFGVRQFGDAGVAATPGFTVTNCASTGESVFAHGSNATDNGPTTWTLNDTGSCAAATLPADNYGLTIERQDTNAQVRLSTVNKSVAAFTAGQAIDHLARIDTPCPGSTGAGIVMTMHIVFVATE